MFDFANFHPKGVVYMQIQLAQVKSSWDYPDYWGPGEDTMRRVVLWWLDAQLDEHQKTEPLLDCLMKVMLD